MTWSIVRSSSICQPATPANGRAVIRSSLHSTGYSVGAEQWSKEIYVPQTIEGASAKGAREMIVVVPDSKTLHNGSMYSSSVTTGDFERFIARDVVSYIDAHYRTLPARESRGLVGHSMGGYGALRMAANTPLYFVDQYISELRRYRAIAIDVSGKDNLRVGATRLHDVLTAYTVKHDFEVYSGDHTNNMAVRFQENVIPFFARTLSFDRAKKP